MQQVSNANGTGRPSMKAADIAKAVLNITMHQSQNIFRLIGVKRTGVRSML